ncbi:gamma carbonic anhydrase family protein [Enterococcus sp. LJL51]|uniref:gamma carbonic anhydrase family protein n=1 Tax=Enterococcus sp. LJL51 TaxID=3416656 RepID=UPI003CFAC2D9
MTKEQGFIAESADVYGDVRLAEDVSIWYQTVLRGDNQTIEIGKGSNIQDGTIIHVDPQAAVTIGSYVTIGHQCIIHGCEIKSGALIGMGSILLNHSVIGENSLIGAGSLVTEGTVIPPNVLALGRPATVIRPLTKEEIAKNKRNADHYIELGKKHQNGEFQAVRN